MTDGFPLCHSNGDGTTLDDYEYNDNLDVTTCHDVYDHALNRATKPNYHHSLVPASHLLSAAPWFRLISFSYHHHTVAQSFVYPPKFRSSFYPSGLILIPFHLQPRLQCCHSCLDLFLFTCAKLLSL
jgi:hypothetical protein